MGLLDGKVAIVTGAGHGIGRGHAMELAKQGAQVVVNDLGGSVGGEGRSNDADLTVKIIESRGGVAVANYEDVADHEGAGRVVAQAVETWGRLDILVNNAGLTRDGLILRMSDEDWHTVLDTNLGGVFHTCRAAARGMMKKRGGSIVNLTSVVGIHGNPGQTNYAASKAGLIGFTKSLARELGSRGVRANVIAPGYVQSALTDAIPDDARETMLANTPLGRLGDPENVATAVRFLVSDEASFITGEVLLVDGGLGM